MIVSAVLWLLLHLAAGDHDKKLNRMKSELQDEREAQFDLEKKVMSELQDESNAQADLETRLETQLQSIKSELQAEKRTEAELETQLRSSKSELQGQRDAQTEFAKQLRSELQEELKKQLRSMQSKLNRKPDTEAYPVVAGLLALAVVAVLAWAARATWLWLHGTSTDRSQQNEDRRPDLRVPLLPAYSAHSADQDRPIQDSPGQSLAALPVSPAPVGQGPVPQPAAAQVFASEAVTAPAAPQTPFHDGPAS